MPDDVLVTVLTKADCSSATKLCKVLHCHEGVWEDACRERGWADEKPVDRTWKEQFAYHCTRIHTNDTIREAVQVVVLLPPPYVHPFYGPIAGWDVSEVTDMNNLFFNALAFNGDLSRWDVGKVADMTDMFAHAMAFNGDLSRWDVSKVTNMKHMFFGATAFNGDLSRWDVSKVTNTEDSDSDSDSDSDEEDPAEQDMFYYADAYDPVHALGTRASLPRPERPLLPLLPDRSTWPQWPNPLPKVPTLLPLDD